MARRTVRSELRRPLQLSKYCRELGERLAAMGSHARIRALLRETKDVLFAQTHRDLDDRQLADSLGQALIQARVAWAMAADLRAAIGQPGALPPGGSLLSQLLRLAVGPSGLGEPPVAELRAVEELLSLAESAVRQQLPTRSPAEAGPIDFDVFLGAHDPKGRSRDGVFFTPRPLAAFIVRETDRLLREEFGLSDGLADTTTWSQLPGSLARSANLPRDGDKPFIRILDPAAGAGVFLIAVIDQVFANFQRGLSSCGAASEKNRDAWNEYVARHLLPRLHGRDLLLPACAVAWIAIANRLARTGYRFEIATPLELTLADSLLEPVNTLPATVIVGNPPFAALTTSGNRWIDGLLRSASLNGRRIGSYYEVDGAALAEKKLWLHDDYVKFLRYAQSQIEEAGAGLVAFVTNHGYLDNLTFRGMRQSLLNSFPRISVLDLHGNRKKRELSPGGGADENVFGIDQGIAIGFLRQPPRDLPAAVMRADLWGSRAGKLASLEASAEPKRACSELSWRPIAPATPNYLFTHDQVTTAVRAEYARGFPLDEIMPIHSTAAVTARDSFVVGFSAEEVVDRMRALADDRLTEAELRQRYFHHTRSRRYLPGDTRGWKLAVVRQRARAIADFRPLLRRCLYRPFDWRWVLWADWMIDWPRTEFMRHMLAGDNLALVTRRQMLPQQPANYFFVSDSIVIDGVIRSDNRGSESFFPLFLSNTDRPGAESHSGDSLAEMPGRRANFSTEFLSRLPQRGAGSAFLEPLDVFFMIYAQFHSGGYRDRYQSELCLGFPHVFIPRSAALFTRLVACGRQLVSAHLLRDEYGPADDVLAGAGGSKSPVAADPVALPKRDWPRHAGTTLWLTPDHCLHDIPADIWQFQIGGYQVCKKWLRDRAGQTLTSAEIGQYRGITRALTATGRITREVDSVIQAAGGWPDAFVGRIQHHAAPAVRDVDQNVGDGYHC